MADIFISYRRDDASFGVAGLREIIEAQLGAGRVFLDQADIRKSEPFPERLRRELEAARILLVVVGPKWLDILVERASGHDWVRDEILTARARGIAVWPVLVDGGELTKSKLPEDLAWLTDHQRDKIGGSTSSSGIDELIRDLERELFDPAQGRPAAGTSFSDADWKQVATELREGTCVPIIGPALGQHAIFGESPSSLDLGQRAGDQALISILGPDLPQVAQVLAITESAKWPKEELQNWGENHTAPDDPDHPYAVLGEIPASLYVTVNFDHHLSTLIRSNGRDPVPIEFSSGRRQFTGIAEGDELSRERPGVVHLFGSYGSPRDMVLTEDDFFELLIAMIASNGDFFPAPVLDRLVQSTSLLFLGFEVHDWRFRLLVRGLVEAAHLLDHKTFAVVGAAPSPGSQAPRLETDEAARFIQKYLGRDLGEAGDNRNFALKPRVVVGNAQSFTDEFRRRPPETA